MIKILSKLGSKEDFLNNSNNNNKSIANDLFHSKKLDTFWLRSKLRQVCPLSPLLLNIVLEVLANAVGKKKVLKNIYRFRKKTYKWLNFQMT